MPSFAYQPSQAAPRQAIRADVILFERPADDDGVLMSYGRDEEIFGEDEPAPNVYRVISGAVRTYRMLADGRRQIVEFNLAGDVFGLDGDGRHALGAEAIGETRLQVLRRSAFLDDRIGGAGSAMEAMMKKFHRAQQHMLLLGRQTACERLSAFLLDFQRRTGDAVIDLPMSRQDIADYLGLTIETVSRTVTHLQNAGLIDLVSSRRIVLRDTAALDRICA